MSLLTYHNFKLKFCWISWQMRMSHMSSRTIGEVESPTTFFYSFCIFGHTLYAYPCALISLFILILCSESVFSLLLMKKSEHSEHVRSKNLRLKNNLLEERYPWWILKCSCSWFAFVYCSRWLTGKANIFQSSFFWEVAARDVCSEKVSFLL